MASSSNLADSAVRLQLPNGQPARGIFPGLPADLDTPVYAACSFTPSSDPDKPARQDVTCPALAPSAAEERLRQCQSTNCAALLAEKDQEASKSSLSSSSSSSWRGMEAIYAGARLNECSLRHCPSEFWATHSSLCVSLDAPILSNQDIVLPQLPPTSASSLTALHQAHLARAAAGTASGRNASSSPTIPTTTTGLQLGICAPAPPLGVPCNTTHVNADGTYSGSIGIPQIDPLPRTAILSRALPAGSAWPRVIEGGEGSALAGPVRLLHMLPGELKGTSYEASIAMNLYALSRCTDGKIAAARAPGEACQRTSDCRYGTCGSADKCAWPDAASVAQGGRSNLAVFTLPATQATPQATTWKSYPTGDAHPNGGWIAFTVALSFCSVVLFVAKVRRAAERKRKGILQIASRPMYALEVRTPARPAPAATRSGARTTPHTTERPRDPDLDEPLPRYEP